ncbi:MAG TPA: hypothetical protein VJZ04_02700 [Lachnospiraceae bacterium]|nr:hypothetical protein [Lachnospiraceae bacterium]
MKKGNREDKRFYITYRRIRRMIVVALLLILMIAFAIDHSEYPTVRAEESPYTIVKNNESKEKIMESTYSTVEITQTQNSTETPIADIKVINEIPKNSVIIWILFLIIAVIEIGGTTVYMRKKKVIKEEKKFAVEVKLKTLP